MNFSPLPSVVAISAALSEDQWSLHLLLLVLYYHASTAWNYFAREVSLKSMGRSYRCHSEWAIGLNPTDYIFDLFTSFV